MEKNISCKKSFTLLELIVVIVVLGILASIALPNYVRFSERSKAAEAKHMLAAIRRSQIRYYAQYSKYNPLVTSLDIERGNTRYFIYSTSSAAPSQVGRAARSTLQRPSGYYYTIYVNENGTYSILPASYNYLL